MKKLNTPGYENNGKIFFFKKREGQFLTWFPNAVLILLLILLLNVMGRAQSVSGTWDAAGTNGTTGYTDHGNGVISLLTVTTAGCVAAAVHETSSTYNPTSGTSFNKCYQVFFGCPGNDNIGSNTDQHGDGMAFSFWKSTATYNVNNGLACGGGLGYMGTPSDNKMFTIEFDTYSSMGTAGFDAFYGGGVSGNHDEIALQRDAIANDGGRITSVDAGNLEDGLEHTVCINYNPTTHRLLVTIDGATILNYDMTGSPYDLPTYFGNVGLNQTWSAAQNGATDPATINDGDGTTITSQLGGTPLCPAGVVVTSPGSGSVFDICNGPIAIAVSATPPAGNTVSSVDILVDGSIVATDVTAPYSTNWTPTSGNHSITAVAHYTPSSTTSTSSAVTITVGAVETTSTAPVIDGSAEALWTSYPAFTLTHGFNSAPSLAANYKIIYDATYLYVLVNVTDNTPHAPNSPANTGNYWNDDAAEIYIDCGNTKSGSYNANDFQYAMARDASNSTLVLETKHSPGSLTGVNGKLTTNATGYVIEMRIPWTTLGCSPTPGTNLGFDVSLDDNATGPARNNQLSWNDGSFGEWNNPSLFGTLPISGCNPLPVELMAFTGEKINGEVVLNWATGAETNNKKFIIERSSNSADWKAIGDVAGVGTTSSISNYSFTDNAPLEGIIYYRLKQIDLNGAISYSTVVAVQTGNQAISIAPNPFDDALTIRTTAKGETDISIYDVLGRLVYHNNLKNESNLLNINPDLSTGAYMITVQTGSSVEHQKIIKR